MNNSNNNSYDSIYNIRYKEGLGVFNKDFVDHFPSNLDQEPLFFDCFTDTELDGYRMILFQKKKKQAIISFNDSIQGIALAKYHANDTCNLVVNQYTNQNNWHQQNKAPKGYKNNLERDCYYNKYPIPNFWRNRFATESNTCKLPDDFDVYVLQAEQGVNFDKRYLTRGIYMPERWKHGYSKGIAISTRKNVLIYWVVVW